MTTIRLFLAATMFVGLTAHAQPSYNEAKRINSDVNQATQYRADTQLYGLPDFWAIADGVGDCEDFALAKRQKFIAAGFGDYVRLALVTVPNVGYHATLIVTTTSGDYVLDNNFDLPVTRQDLIEWEWDKIQQGEKWYAIR